MSNGSVTQETNLPPDWWKRSLYDFIADMPLKGWIWEFMRRGRLLEALEGAPVDAMNPQPNIDDLGGDYIRYYCSYPQIRHKINDLVFFPRSVNQVETWPEDFHGQQYRIADAELKNLKKITVDLNRSDRLIIDDFKTLLSRMRTEHEIPKRVNPRPNDWAVTCILQVWDLRQYECKDKTIYRLLKGLNGQSTVRNAIGSGEDYINKDGWKRLARYVDRY